MVAVLALLIAGLGQAKAEIIVHAAFGPGDSFSPTGGFTVKPTWLKLPTL